MVNLAGSCNWPLVVDYVLIMYANQAKFLSPPVSTRAQVHCERLTHRLGHRWSGSLQEVAGSGRNLFLL